MADHKNNKKLQAGFALFVFAALIIAGAVVSRPSSKNTSAQAVTMASSSSSGSTSQNSTACESASETTKVLNGTYQATGSYDSPGGTEAVKVSLTLSNDVVTAASVQSETNDPTAAAYQSYFISGYKSQVVGKKVSDIKLTNVAGSSLTSQGFNEALANIVCQAEAA